ncbi:transcription antitermination factor NusB [Candidatus Margulisiibacteriota bacterium]
MGKRSTARRLAMQALFQADVAADDIKKALELLFDEEQFIEDTKKFARKLVTETQENLKDIDGQINKYSKNWAFSRIKSVDKSILRLSVYELLYLKENPHSVVINEALELAKKYSDEESAKFINGILGAMVSDMEKSAKK